MPIIGKGTVEHALAQRRHRPMLFVDIAVPRDIEAEVSEIDEAYLYTVDDLQQIVQENLLIANKPLRSRQSLISSQITELPNGKSHKNLLMLLKHYEKYRNP